MSQQNKLQKTKSGYLFKEEFNNSMNPLWDIFPSNESDRVTVSDNSITLNKAPDRTELLIYTPSSSEYVFQTKLDYTPTATCKGGCLLKSLTEDYIESELFEDGKETPTYIKIIYSKSVITLRASTNGHVWKDYGNTNITDLNSVGYFLEDSGSDLTVTDCLFYENNFVTIKGIKEDNSIEIYNANKEKIISDINIKKINDRAIIDFSDCIFPLDNVTFIIKNKKNEVIAEQVINTLYGGDIYELEKEIIFDIKDVDAFDLGIINTEKKYFELSVTNNSEFEINGFLKIYYTSSYDRGAEMAYLAEYTDITQIHDLNKQMKTNLLAGETKKYYIVIKRDIDCVTIDDSFSFYLTLE